MVPFNIARSRASVGKPRPLMLTSRRPNGKGAAGQSTLRSPLATRHDHPAAYPPAENWLRFPAPIGPGSSQVVICQWLTPEPIGFVLALFYHCQVSPAGFTGQWPLVSRRSPHATRHTPRPARRLPTRRELASFSRPNRPWFVLSHNMPTINATSNWLCSGTFRSPPAPRFAFTGH